MKWYLKIEIILGIVPLLFWSCFLTEASSVRAEMVQKELSKCVNNEKVIDYYATEVISQLLVARKKAPAKTDEVRLVDPLGVKEGKIEVIISRIIKILLGIAGSSALIAFLYGGVTWLTSGGNPEKIKKGKNILTYSIIGLAVIFFGYAILNFILTALEEAAK